MRTPKQMPATMLETNATPGCIPLSFHEENHIQIPTTYQTIPHQQWLFPERGKR